MRFDIHSTQAYQRHVLFDAPGYSKVDPDAVNLKKYPGLAEAPWWEVKVEAGDCLFIPLELVFVSNFKSINCFCSYWHGF